MARFLRSTSVDFIFGWADKSRESSQQHQDRESSSAKQQDSTFDLEAAHGVEDHAIPLSVTLPTKQPDKAKVFISGLPEGARLSAGSQRADGTWKLDASELDGLTLTPPKDYAGTLHLDVTARLKEGKGQRTDISTELTVIVAAEADVPGLKVSSPAVVQAQTTQATTVMLDIQAALTDLDGSESLCVIVAGVPSSCALSAGTMDAEGNWVLTADEAPGVQLILPAGIAGDFDLAVTARSEEGSNGDTRLATRHLQVQVEAPATDIVPEPPLEAEPDPVPPPGGEGDAGGTPEAPTPDGGGEPEVVADPTAPIGLGTPIPGIDYEVGCTGDVAALKDPTTLPSWGAPIIYKSGQIRILEDGAVLDGYDLRDVVVTVRANDVVIKNCLGNAAGWITIDQYAGHSGLIVEDCTFDGQKADMMTNPIILARDGAMTVRRCAFIDLPEDAIRSVGGTIEENYFAGSGYRTGGHADAISVGSTVAPVVIRNNFIDWQAKDGDTDQHLNNAVRIVAEFGDIDDVLITGNVIRGGAYSIEVSHKANTVSNVTIEGNYIDPGHFGHLYPAGIPDDLAFLGNHDLSTGDALHGPMTMTMVAAAAVGGDDPFLLIGTADADTLEGATAADRLYGGDGRDTLIGGGGSDLLQGGDDPDRFIYHAGDSGADGVDVILDFTRGQDKIDLSRIDADPRAAGDQPFRWLGTDEFTGAGGELRYTTDGERTYVAGDLDGDGMPELEIQMVGQHALKSADFLL